MFTRTYIHTYHTYTHSFNVCSAVKVYEIQPFLFKIQLSIYYRIGGLFKSNVSSPDYEVSKCGIISEYYIENNGEGSKCFLIAGTIFVFSCSD